MGIIRERKAVTASEPAAPRNHAYEVLEVGGVVVNDVPSIRVDNMPYGGIKDSGLGREGVRFAMEDMTEIKLLVLNRTGRL